MNAPRWLSALVKPSPADCARILSEHGAAVRRSRIIATAMDMRRTLNLPPYPGYEREQGA